MLRVSVVVATYNRKSLLLGLLRDLEQQDLDASTFEVVVVDDGSAEPVRPLTEALDVRYALTVFEQLNAGQAAARDRGIRAASGEVIVVIDDDMSLPPHFLSAHLSEHQRGATVVLGMIRPSPQLRQMPLFERFHARQLQHFVEAVRRGEPVRGAALCTGNVSFRRADYLAIGGFDRSLARSEDRDLGIRLEAAGGKLSFSEDAYTTHRSDHSELPVWLRRARLYGIYDARIAHKHASIVYVDPWRFLFLVSPISAPALLLASALPAAGRALSRVTMATAQRADRLGLESLAIQGTTLVYGLEYFLGVREASGSLLGAARGLSRYSLKALIERRRKGAA
jgi:glycosyltransferase involved in cell wall biosynthesis